MRSPGRKPRCSPASTAGRVEHDALHLAAVQGLDRLGDGEVALAGAGRSDAEGDDRGVDGVGVALLARGRRSHRLALGAAHDLVAQDLARSQVVVDHVDRARDLGGVEGLAALQDEDQLVEEAQHLGGVGAGHGDLVALDADLGLGERVLDDAQVLVAGSEQSRHQMRIRYEGGRREGLLGRGIKGHPGWPLHSTSAEDVHVQVGHGHLAVTPDVEDQAVPALADALEVRDLLGQQDQVVDDAAVAARDLVGAGDVFSRRRRGRAPAPAVRCRRTRTPVHSGQRASTGSPRRRFGKTGSHSCVALIITEIPRP